MGSDLTVDEDGYAADYVQLSNLALVVIFVYGLLGPFAILLLLLLSRE